jgi:hypothetical protein
MARARPGCPIEGTMNVMKLFSAEIKWYWQDVIRRFSLAAWSVRAPVCTVAQNDLEEGISRNAFIITFYCHIIFYCSLLFT